MIRVNNNNNNNINNKRLFGQYPRKEHNSVGHLLHGLDKLIVKEQWKVHQMENKLRKDKRVSNGEFSNGDGKKLCYLMA